MANDIIIRMKLAADGLKAGLASASDRIKTFGADVAAATKKAMMAIGAMLAGIVAAGKKAVDAFVVQEDAVNNLTAALRNNGDDAAAIVPKLTNLASAIQSQTKYGDEAIVSAMAYGRNLGITANAMEAATVAAVGLASKYRIDLQSAMQLVGRASQGQTQMLSRYGIVLDDSLTPQQKFNELLRIGAGAFDLAKQEAQTTGGQIQQLRNQFGDLQESFGEAIVKTGLVAKAISWLKSKTYELQASGSIQKWASSAKEAIKGLRPAVEWIGNAFSNIGRGVSRVAGFAGAIAGGASFKDAWKQVLRQEDIEIASVKKVADAREVEQNKATDSVVQHAINGGGIEMRVEMLNAEEVADYKKKLIDEINAKQEANLQRQRALEKQIANERRNIEKEMVQERLEGAQKVAKQSQEQLKKLGISDIATLEEKMGKLRAKQGRGIKLSKQDEAIFDAGEKLLGAREIIKDMLKNQRKLKKEDDAARLAELTDQEKQLNKLKDEAKKWNEQERKVNELTGEQVTHLKNIYRSVDKMNDYLKTVLSIS